MRCIPLAIGILAATTAIAQNPVSPPANPNARPNRQGTLGRMAPGVNGEITAVKPSSLTVRTRQGTLVEVTFTAQTPLLKSAPGVRGQGRTGGNRPNGNAPGTGQPGVAPGTRQGPNLGGVPIKATDLKPGLRVMAQGAWTTDLKAFNATRILVMPPQVDGTVADLTANKIGIKDATGKVRFFALTPQTRFQKNRQQATVADYKVGEAVTVQYEGGNALMIREARPAQGTGTIRNPGRRNRQGSGNFGIPGNTAPSRDTSPADRDLDNE